MAGASGYVLKQIRGNDLVESVRKVGRGESLLDPEMTDRVFRRIRGEEADDPLLSRLSKQERKILDYIAAGLTNRQIAEEMFLAEKTVKNYVSNVLAKLEMSRRSEAAAYAARIDAEKEHRYPPEQWPQ
jgi:DNA-binding NarL/FixJ family response regulator